LNTNSINSRIKLLTIRQAAKVWEFDTQKCGTLYISLGDTIDRLWLRLSRITESGLKDTLFTTSANNLTTGLIEQLEAFMTDYPDTGLIVIDTFQRIRDNKTKAPMKTITRKS